MNISHRCWQQACDFLRGNQNVCHIEGVFVPLCVDVSCWGVEAVALYLDLYEPHTQHHEDFMGKDVSRVATAGEVVSLGEKSSEISHRRHFVTAFLTYTSCCPVGVCDRVFRTPQILILTAGAFVFCFFSFLLYQNWSTVSPSRRQNILLLCFIHGKLSQPHLRCEFFFLQL